MRDSLTDYHASGIAYTPHGAMMSLQFGAPNGPAGLAETIGYNSRLQPESMRVGPADTAQWNLQNFYCPTPGTACAGNNGNVLSQTLDMPAGANRLNLAWAYAYDGANRLATAGEGSAWSLSYGYDRFGNVSVGDLNGVQYAGQSCPSYDAATNRCNGPGFGYDAAGNMTAFPGSRTALYDAENRQYSLTHGGTTQYVYDGEGRRVQKVVGGQTTTYVYDAAGNLAAEYGGAAQTAPCTRCYVTVDHLGSTRLVMDAATGNVMRRYDYTPFGGEIGPSWSGRTTATGYGSDTMEPKFTGKQRDYESGLGLDYFGARYFSGAQGRFTTPGWSERPEPVPYADFKDTQSLNLYAYGRNNPLGVVDHEGHLGCGFLWLGSCPDPPPPASPKPPPAPSNPVYGTVDASGVAAATADKQQTDDRRAAGDPVEYGNSVFAIGGVAYTYTDPLTQNRRGTVDPNNTTGYFDPRTASLFDPPIPTGTQLVGEAHSHPDMAMDRNGDPLPPRDRLSGASGDKGRTTLMPKAQKYFQGTYVSLPDGRVIKYTPQGRISVFR